MKRIIALGSFLILSVGLVIGSSVTGASSTNGAQPTPTPPMNDNMMMNSNMNSNHGRNHNKNTNSNMNSNMDNTNAMPSPTP